ncbi:peflin [Lutzomyia longipalpis]|uniref:Putative ca2+-binding protein n=1 Tax=Lutzomyia longipalpis TaxID=7200 RepID=A0A1B0CM05_LUTLO|nr:peflin [Lutzomyia longipalpis]
MAYQGYQGGYGGYGGQQPGGYNQNQGGYGAPPPMMGGAPGINPETQRIFGVVDRDRSGKINAEELKSALVNGRGQNFSDTACRLMIGMFDQDHSGTIDINEFDRLYTYINQWLNAFKSYDRDSSGHIDEGELSSAFQQMGFRFSPDFIKFLVKKSDPQNHREISVDQFIVLCVQIQRFTEAFRQRDSEQKGIIQISFEDFISVALSCST